MADRTARLAGPVGTAQKALARGERPAVGQLRDLVRASESHLRAAPEQAEVAALFDLLARGEPPPVALPPENVVPERLTGRVASS